MSRRASIALQADAPFLETPALPDVFSTAALVLDIVLIIVAGQASRWIYGFAADVHTDESVYIGSSLVLAVTFILLMRGRGSYDAGSQFSLERQIRSTILCWSVSFALAISVGFLLKASADLSRGAVLLFAVFGLAALLGRRIVWRIALVRAVATGAIRTRKAVLISPAEFGPSQSQLAALRRSGIEVVHSVNLPVGDADRPAALAEVIGFVRRVPVDEIIVSLGSSSLSELGPIATQLRLTPLPLRLLPDAELSRLTMQKSRSVGPFALVDITREPLSPAELAWKRVLDLLIAGFGLLLVAPLLVLAFAAIRLDTPGPVLFRQSRQGFNGRMFKILKLRSMTVMEDGPNILQARRRDPRVTRVGYWLRRTSIDELPQLWNVLRGEMSIVGPRPHAVAHDNYYDKLIENYAFRHHVKPGLTGWAQVNGHRGETPDVSSMAARIDHDVWYISNWSFLLDLRILLLTFTKLLAKTAY